MTLPPFPVDDQTLDLVEEALDCNEEKPQSDLGSLLEVYSQLAGSDLDAVLAEYAAGVKVMRDPRYGVNDLILALVAEVRRLRAVYE